MGKTSVFKELGAALVKTKDWPVVSASEWKYYNDDTWKDEVVAAEEFSERKENQRRRANRQLLPCRN